MTPTPPNLPPKHPRMLARGDGFKVIPIGRSRAVFSDLYIRLLGGNWPTIALVLGVVFLGINLIFASAYLALGNGVANARPGSFADAFFFSVQTFATIGYGGMVPKSVAANLLVTIEALFGFCYTGVVAGLVFSKFARPTARILFSDKAVISTHDGKPHFMLRLVNERDNRIVDAQAKLTLMRDELTAEGKTMRRFYTLPLVRSENPLLRLSWTVMHEINEASPLNGMDHEALQSTETEIIVSISGLDETLSQIIHARNSYIAEEIIWGAAFADVLHRKDDFVLEVRYDRFHDLKDEG
ncbi:MAG: ion channel [Alphaproteobacteria bacterium]